MKMCSVCQGNKQIRGLGMMKEDCHGCNGLGTVEGKPLIEFNTVSPAATGDYVDEIVVINDVYIPTQEELDNPHPGTITALLKDEKVKAKAKPKAKKK